MSYILQERYNSKNQLPGPQAGEVWGLGPRVVTSITIHHWGVNGQQFDTVRDFLCTNNTPTSAHYIVQDSLVACIVSPDDCAFHSGNPEGNTFSIGIECRPEATDGDYQTIAELVKFIRNIYGDIPLFPHNHWYNTACPGDYDLTRIDSLARSTPVVPALPSKEEPDMTASDVKAALLDPEILDAIALAILHRVNRQVDPSGATDNFVEGPGTTLSDVIHKADHNHAQVITGLEELHTVVNKLLPAPAHSDPVPVIPVSTTSNGA